MFECDLYKKNKDLLIGNDLHIKILVNNNTQWQLIKCRMFTEEKKNTY